jgi:hypothetical protein
MHTDWKVVYDFAVQPPPLVCLVALLLGLASGLVFRAVGRWLAPEATRVGSIVAPAKRAEFRTALRLALGLATVGALAVGVLTASRYAEAQYILRSGRAGLVEGLVQEFHPMPRTGHDSEHFTVRGVRFQYPQNGMGFSQTAAEGGPIREGLHVRIHYVPTSGCEELCGATILRLEVKG